MSRFSPGPAPAPRSDFGPQARGPVPKVQLTKPVGLSTPKPRYTATSYQALRPSVQNDNAAGQSNFAALSGALFVFVVVSRFSEVFTNIVGVNLKIAFLTAVVTGIMAFLTGRLPDTLARPGTVAVLLLTTWLIFCIPFSFWRGGSVGLIKDTWSLSLISFVMIAAIPNAAAHLKLYAGAMAWAGILMMLVLLKYGTVQGGRGSMEFASSLSNPNIMALQLLMCLPFLVYWVRTRPLFSFKGLLGLVSCFAVAVLIVLRTGSRSGLLGLIAVTLAIFAGMSIRQKAGFVAVTIVVVLITIPFVPEQLLRRYATFTTAESDDTSEAAESSKARAQHLWESLVLTASNPVFGVGPGQFTAASAELAREGGRAALWRETHNMYTQVSSECGIPGLILYLTMIGVSLSPIWRDLRQASRSGKIQMRHEFGRALLNSAFGLMVTGVFCSFAYMYYWCVLCGMGVAYQRVAANEIRAQQA